MPLALDLHLMVNKVPGSDDLYASFGFENLVLFSLASSKEFYYQSWIYVQSSGSASSGQLCGLGPSRVVFEASKIHTEL